MIAMIILGMMLYAASTGGAATLPQNIIGVVTSPIQKLSSSISGAATNLLAGFTTYSSVHTENEKLKKQVTDLTSKLIDYDKLQRENQQYKEFLGLKEENPDFKFEPAMVISRSNDQWSSSFTIDKGSLDGIAVNDPVITSEGLVGIVTSDVMPTSAVVTTILDPQCNVGAIISHTGDVCIAQGSKELIANGQLKVVYLNPDSGVAKGDIVITSGIGGYTPKGLKIGTVEDIKTESSGMLSAITRPMADPTNAKNVFVITSFKGKASTLSSSSQTSKK